MAANPFRPLADAWDRLVGSDAEASGLVAWLAGFRARQLFRDAALGPDVQVFGRPVLHLADGATLQIGSGVQVSARAARTRIEVGPGATLQIGAGAVLDDVALVQAYGRVVIGENARVGFGVAILDDEGVPGREPVPVVIGAEVRIGARATLLRGVRIGRGATVAAGALVIGDVPAGATVGGVPAQVVEQAEVSARVAPVAPERATPAEPEAEPSETPAVERATPAPAAASGPAAAPAPAVMAPERGDGADVPLATPSPTLSRTPSAAPDEQEAEKRPAVATLASEAEAEEGREDEAPVWPPHARRRA